MFCWLILLTRSFQSWQNSLGWNLEISSRFLNIRCLKAVVQIGNALGYCDFAILNHCSFRAATLVFTLVVRSALFPVRVNVKSFDFLSLPVHNTYPMLTSSARLAMPGRQ